VSRRTLKMTVPDMGLGIRDHLRLEVERRGGLKAAEALDQGPEPGSRALAREARRRAIVAQVTAVVGESPRAAALAAALGEWLRDEDYEAVALDRLIVKLDEMERKGRADA
jgi:hypothetical protein